MFVEFEKYTVNIDHITHIQKHDGENSETGEKGDVYRLFLSDGQRIIISASNYKKLKRKIEEDNRTKTGICK